MKMEKINLVELLKNCPKGMELDSPLVENLIFDYINEDSIDSYPIHCLINNDDDTLECIVFTKDGCNWRHPQAKCVIFPKGKTTWEGFTPHCKFKDGDVLSNGASISIHNGYKDRYHYGCYVAIGHRDHPDYFVDKENNNYVTKDEIRFATEEEKERLFQAIKDNGYKWNAEKKLIEPNFTDGDIIVCNNGARSYISIYKGMRGTKSYFYHANLIFKDDAFATNDWADYSNPREATEEEKQKIFQAIKDNGYQWNAENKILENLIKPRFTVGDKIKYKGDDAIGRIEKIEDNVYHVDYGYDDGVVYVGLKSQDDYELVPNKFDITTLKPFGKVLVRDNDEQLWLADLFGFYGKTLYPFMCVGHYTNQCVPYEGNEHLLGTTDDCDEYYKNWK